jgi:hypothetical protein
MGWLLAALLGGLWWYRSRAVSPTSSPLVLDAVTVYQAQTMLHQWMNSAGLSGPAWTNDPTLAPTGNANDPVFQSALTRFQGWAGTMAIEFQDRPGAGAHYLRQDGVLDKATLGVLTAVTQPAIFGSPVLPVASHASAGDTLWEMR